MLSPDVFKQGFSILSMMKGMPSSLNEEKDSSYVENRKMLYNLMSDLEDEAFKEAVSRIAREDEFFPSPARIIKLAQGNKYLTAGEAWAMVRKKIADDWKRDVEGFPPEVVKAVQCMGGMNAIADRKWGEDNEFEHFIKREFVEAYKDLLDAAKNDPKVMAIGSEKRQEETVSLKDGLKNIGFTSGKGEK